jgi:hypothetical protein
LTTIRALPRSLDPLPNESITGYLLRLAYRLNMRPSRLVVATGLITHPRGLSQALMRGHEVLGTNPKARVAFGSSTRLSADEVNSLFLSQLEERYPPLRSAISSLGHTPRGPHDQWLFLKRSRYCPDCLDSSISEPQSAFGGTWNRFWLLPVVFSCHLHGRLLNTKCSSGHAALESEYGTYLPRWGDPALHPAQCRATPDPTPRRRRTSLEACGAWLPGSPRNVATPSEAVATQKRILDALDMRSPGTVESLGRIVSSHDYFSDLFQLAHLVRRSLPASSGFLEDPSLSSALQNVVAEDEQVAVDLYPNQRQTFAKGRKLQYLRYRPPFDSSACAALLTVADKLLRLESPSSLTDQLRNLFAKAYQEAKRNNQAARILMNRPDISPGFRRAIAPIVAKYPATNDGRQTSGSRITRLFGPEHIAQALQPDWFEDYFAHFEGFNPSRLRRAVALLLCQMTMPDGNPGDAGVRLGMPDTRKIRHRCISTVADVKAWTRTQNNPHAFKDAVFALADHIGSVEFRVNYDQRRRALHGWSIGLLEWRKLVDQFWDSEYDNYYDNYLADRKRQGASIIVWSRVTRGEHLFAPQPIRDQQDDQGHTSWNSFTYGMFVRFRNGATSHLERRLETALADYSEKLAETIDSGAYSQLG